MTQITQNKSQKWLTVSGQFQANKQTYTRTGAMKSPSVGLTQAHPNKHDSHEHETWSSILTHVSLVNFVTYNIEKNCNLQLVYIRV